MFRILLVFTVVIGAAQAEIISQSAFLADWGQPNAQWRSSVELPFHRFDPALGELTSVRISSSADIGMVFPSWPTGSPDWMIVQNSLYTNVGYSYQTFTHAGVPASSVNTSTRVSNQVNQQFFLDNYIGKDLWSLTAVGDVWVYLQNPPNAPIPTGALSLRNLSVQVEYEYTPVPAVAAEPRYAALLILGSVIIGSVARTKMRGRGEKA